MNSNTVEQNERLFQIDTSCVLIWLFFLDSNHLDCQDTHDTQWIQYHSSSRSQTSSVTIQNLLYQRYTFVLALTITSCIILLKDTLLLSSYSTLRIWWLRAVSTYGSLANCWQTQSVHIIKMIPLLIIHMCGHIHASPTHALSYYSCRGQPSELDIPWSDIQRIGSLSYDSFFVSCLNLEDILSLLPVAGHLEGWYIAYLLFYCLDSSYPCFHSEENVRWHTSHKHTYRFHNDNSRPLNTYSYHTWPIPFQECLIQSSGSISYSFQTYPW